MKLACRRLSSRRRNESGMRTDMKIVIQMRPDSIHAGGSVVSDVKSWYIDFTTLGIKPLMMIR